MTGRQDVFQQAMNQGHSAAWDQMWDRAAGFYRQALEEFPDNPQALTNLGLALMELQDFEEALRCYQKAAKVLPDDPLPLEKVAQLHERMGNIDQAARASLRAAELYLNQREVNKAIENWERVTRLNPDNLHAHSRLALVWDRLGEKQKAVTECLAAASLMQSSGEMEKAMQWVNRALQIFPNHEEALRARALLKDFKPLPKPARPHGATAAIRKSQVRQLQAPQVTSQAEQELDPVAEALQKALTVLADILFEGVEDDKGGAAARRGLQAIVTGTAMLQKPVDRTRMLLHLSQTVDLQTRGQLQQAAEELQRAIDVGLERSAAYFDLGYLHAQMGRVESAIRYLQHATRSPEFSLGAYLLLGDLWRKKGQIKEASIAYLEALKSADAQVVPAEQSDDLRQLYEPLIEAHRQSSTPEVQTRLCDNIRGLLMRAGWRVQLSQARSRLPGYGGSGLPVPLAEMLTDARSNQMIEAMSQIDQWAKKGYLRSAMEESFFALQQAPTYLPLHAMMGELMAQQGDLHSAIEKYLVVAKTYSIRSEAQQAVKLLRRVIELDPMELRARKFLIEQLITYGEILPAVQEYLALAEAYISMADLNSARKVYTEALRTAQQSNIERSWRVKILSRMADIDLQSLDWRQALRIFEQIRTLQPDDEETRLKLIDINFRLGQEQQAISELDDYLAFLGSTHQLEKMATFMEGLAENYPSSVLVRRRLVDIYRHQNRIPEAIAQLDAIGERLLDAGDRRGAIQTVEMILALNPPNKAEYQQLLDQMRRGL